MCEGKDIYTSLSYKMNKFRNPCKNKQNQAPAEIGRVQRTSSRKKAR
jgi:hypothetical protein